MLSRKKPPIFQSGATTGEHTNKLYVLYFSTMTSFNKSITAFLNVSSFSFSFHCFDWNFKGFPSFGMMVYHAPALEKLGVIERFNISNQDSSS